MHAAQFLLAFASASTATISANAKLLVVGASGGTGARALRGLLDVGYAPAQLRVLTRDPTKPTLAPLREMGMELCAADLDDPVTLVGVSTTCTGAYVHSTAGDTKQLDTGEVARARHLAAALAEDASITGLVYNSAAAEATHSVQRIAQKHAVEFVFSVELGMPSVAVTHLRANLFMEELWKGYTRPQILKGTYPFAVPPSRDVYLTSVRDMGRLAGACLAEAADVAAAAAADSTGTSWRRQYGGGESGGGDSGDEIVSSSRIINVASDVLTPVQLAAAFAAAQGSPCVHSQARVLRWIARLFLPDLYEVIQFYRTSTETTDVAALEDRFPELLTSFDTFLAETKWGDADATYEDLAVL